MDLDDLDAFLAVVRAGSVVTAAESLQVPRSTLRRRLDELEARVGVPLLLRSHAGVALSPAGEVLAHRGRLIGEQYNALLDAVREESKTLRGTVRLAIPAGLPYTLLFPLFDRIATRHPGLSLSTLQREEPLLAVPREAHVAAVVSAVAPDGPWTSVAAVTLDEGAWATRAWLDSHGMPTQLSQVAAGVGSAWSVGGAWPIRGGGFIEVNPRLQSEDAGVILDFAHTQGGITWLPEAVARRSGELVPVLPRQLGRVRSIWISTPQSLAGVARIREVLEAAQAAQR